MCSVCTFKRISLGQTQNIFLKLLLYNLKLILQCYYLGGLEDSATGILGELSKPLSWSMPAEKVCEKLKKKDSQICDLRYGKFLLLAYMS
jgi:hypothetical protein